MAIDKLTLDDLIAVNEEIAALVRAGVPLERGLAEVAAELPSRSGRLAARLAERTEQGATLTEAIEAEGDRLPGAYRAVVAAGLRSGRLDAAVQGLVDTARRLADLRRATGLALVYPLIIVIAAWALMGVALFAILPHIGDLSIPHPVTAAPPLSAWTVVLVGTLLLLGLVTIGLAFGWRRAARADAVGRWGRGRRGFGRGVSFRRVRQLSQAAAFADYLALLVEHHVPLPEALELSVDAAGARSLHRQVAALAADVRAGRRTAEAREPIAAFPALVRLALLSDRDEPAMSAGLRAAADTYRHRADQDADWLTLRTPVVLTLVLGGGTVVVYAALVLAPYISALHSMTEWL